MPLWQSADPPVPLLATVQLNAVPALAAGAVMTAAPASRPSVVKEIESRRASDWRMGSSFRSSGLSAPSVREHIEHQQRDDRDSVGRHVFRVAAKKN